MPKYNTMGTLSLLEEAVFRSYVELLAKRKNKTKIPNIMLQELAGLHSNTSINDVTIDFRKDIQDVSSSLLSYFTKMGFTVVPRET